jgi:hypothetical protein
MKNRRFAAIALASFLLFVCSAFAGSAFAEDTGKMVKVPAEKARVFVTDSQSWEVSSGGGGTAGGFGTEGSGGARPQTAEIIKTFSERCADVTVNNIRQKTDYIVVLEHEGGKTVFNHRNKVAVFGRVSGDSVMSKSTYSLGASVQEACAAIRADWAKNSESMRAAEAEEAPMRPHALMPFPMGSPARNAMLGTRIMVASTPDGADIAVDGSFVGNTPSTVNVPEGDHTVTVTKNGYKGWERKIKSMGGNVRLNAELEAQQDAAK